ncbi:MAG: bifunctional riboflavin kinase/FAD synthetase, partial [Actinobacteria bacterium]|nr:bifunctional riboflavin kinase/FAD synthetase [Actinomycetota bacterium]
MKVYHSLDELSPELFAAGTAIAIGKFDGVHLGHHALLADIAETAEHDGLEPLVFTFENNPLSLLRPGLCPQPIMSPRQRIEALADAGATVCVMVPFDEALAEVPAEEFIERVLVG